MTARCRAVSASDDQTLKVWDLGSGRELLSLQAHEGAVNAVACSQDSKILLSAGEDRIIQVYAMDIDLLMSLARSRVTRNLTPEDCERYLHRKDVPELPGSDEPLKEWYAGRY
jgi:WD40 repeat protein